MIPRERPIPRLIHLEGPRPDGAVLLLCDAIHLADDQTESWETITRVVRFDDDFYGEVEITRGMLDSMVRNFAANVYGQDIAINVAHSDHDGAGGFIRELTVERNRLRGRIEWTPFGVEAVTQRGFRYFSAEYHENWKHPETGKKHGATLLGAALTIRPRVKGLDAIDPRNLALSFDALADDQHVAISPHMQRALAQELDTMWKKLIDRLRKQLSETHKLPEAAVTKLAEAYEAAVKGITEEAQAQALLDQYGATGKLLAEQLADAKPGAPVTINLALPDPAQAPADPGGTKTLSEADVQRILAESLQAQQTSAAAQARKLAENRQAFSDQVGEAEGIKALSEELRKSIVDPALELISADMTAEQITRLAEHHITLGNQIAVQAQLAARGFEVRGDGSPRSLVPEEQNHIKALAEQVERRLGLADMPASRRYESTGGALQAENRALAEKVLAIYDDINRPRLLAEYRELAGGSGVVSDTSIPASFERTVIAEALYSLVGLQFVDVGTVDYNSAGYQIPYSYRDTTAAGINSTRVYETGAIARSGMVQALETAYTVPQKLSFLVSDEVRYLTGQRHINWDAVGENQRNASRIIGEDLERLLFNEVLHASDEFGAVAVSNENLELQADDTLNVFVLAQFPVVRPRQVFAHDGSQIGSTANPITVTYNAVARSEYDGSGTQPAGIYYVLDYNLGEIHLVDEAGAVQVPANGTAYTISYSYASNTAKWDTDLGSLQHDEKYNELITRIGARKVEVEDTRFHRASMGLLSGAVENDLSDAKKFGANFRVPATELGMNGNVGRVKDIPFFKTSAPALWMGDQRLVVGERGVTRFRMAKPWMMGELENARDSNGKFTGQKEAYGDQFVVVHTPTQLKRAYSTVTLYSASARVARTI